MKYIQRITYGGLVVALSGFGITRLFLVETLQVDATLPFLIAGLLPLVVGLVLTVYGVMLAIGPFTAEYVNTVARWHVLGVGSMGVVFAITAADQFLRSGHLGIGYDAPLLVANVLLGGAVGGTLTGIRTGRINHQRRELQRSADRGRLVNRLLRHEVLNAISIIGGHTDLLNTNGDASPDSMTAIQGAVRRIKSTVEEVGTITKDGDWHTRVDLEPIVRQEIRAVETEYGVDVSVAVLTDDTEVAAVSAESRFDRFVSGPFRSGLLGLRWGTVLWLLAAGILMPAWLSALGIPTPIPNLSLNGFVGHALWGIVLGVTCWGLGSSDIRSRLRRNA